MDEFTIDEERNVSYILGCGFDEMIRPYSIESHSSKSHKRIEKISGYHFIPFNPQTFARFLIRAKKEFPTDYIKSKSFLDCGCGIGWTLLVARGAGFTSYGIEYDKDLIKTAKRFSGFNKDKIMEGNLLRFKDYGKYDVIYYYHPFSDSINQNKFERLLFTNMRVGALVISCRTSRLDKKFLKECGMSYVFESFTNSILRKIK
jgi:SAM-dependent methyltransferase